VKNNTVDGPISSGMFTLLSSCFHSTSIDIGIPLAYQTCKFGNGSCSVIAISA
jgi:hypothetical protein